jgi:hypothetical protein
MKNREAFVYFIQAKNSKKVKIGRAVDPEKRLKELQTGNPEELSILGLIDCESIYEADCREEQLHKEFQHLRLQGEWFDFGPEIIDWAVHSGWIGESYKEIQSVLKQSIKQCRSLREGMTPCTTASSNYAGA